MTEFMEENKLFLGVDVGSTSVRCAAVSSSGRILKTSSSSIKTWNPSPYFYEQSTDDIWAATCKAVKDVLESYNTASVIGIGFDATCSLVALGSDLKPVSISLSGDCQRNVIMWIDHRAITEADEINSTGHSVLRYVGGKIHCEMNPPKLLWLKKNLPNQWEKINHFMGLSDFMTWRATGSFSRSLCEVVCKWMYQANEKKQSWDSSFWKKIGLEELTLNDFCKIGNCVQVPGLPCGSGLRADAAKELGLSPHTSVSTSIIDAHAGGIGLLRCKAEGTEADWSSRMAMICGTSTCNMMVNCQPVFAAGVWGPYYSAMVPGMWLSEAGQSCVGALIDHVIRTHPASEDLQKKFPKMHIQEVLNELVGLLAEKNNLKSKAYLTSDLHMWPDFHGNRSPIADPSLKGMIMGLTMSANEDDLAKLYLATVQALAYGTRHIISSCSEAGQKILCIVMCGGMAKNELYVQTHADVTGLSIIIPDEIESVLLGSAILGAAASKAYSSVDEAMKAMCGTGKVFHPNKDDQRYHEMKYQVFQSMLQLQQKAHHLMAQVKI